MEFYDFLDEYSALHRQSRKNPKLRQKFDILTRGEPPEKFYEYVARDVYRYQFAKKGLISEETAARQAIFNLGMASYYKFGKPYCKVHPQMAMMLMNTRLEFDNKFLMWPFDAFSIRLPKENNPVREGFGSEVRSIMVMGRTSDPDNLGRRKRHLQIWIDQGTSERDAILQYDQPTYGYVDIYLFEGETLEQTFDRTLEENFGDIQNPRHGSKEYMRRVLATAVAVSFFMVGNHQLVAPDIPMRYYEKFHAARKKGTVEANKEMQEILEKSKKLGFHGSVLGREIELPRPVVEHIYENGNPNIGSGYSLTWGHYRTGHIRLQPKGPRDNPYIEVVYVMPTIVRPDLPIKPNGYVIKDNLIDERYAPIYSG